MRIFKTTLFATLLLSLSSVSFSADLAKAQEAYFSGDYQTALAEWQPLAEEGMAKAQFGLGLLYANGFGVTLDDAQALKWYLLAAEQGHAEAQCNLAVMHANGWGVPSSSEEAFKWYSLAAEQGVVAAQANLGSMYTGGFGTDVDKVQGFKWYMIATKLGDGVSTAGLEDVSRAMTIEEHTQANLLVTAWMETYQNLQAGQ